MRCGVAIAAVRKLPDGGAEQVTQALLHEPLELRERAGGWASIVTAYRYPGWILADAIEDAPGTLPGPSPVEPLAIAHDLVGAPYEWGGLTGHGIDCSGSSISPTG